jgi:hypothetical protein
MTENNLTNYVGNITLYHQRGCYILFTGIRAIIIGSFLKDSVKDYVKDSFELTLTLQYCEEDEVKKEKVFKYSERDIILLAQCGFLEMSMPIIDENRNFRDEITKIADLILVCNKYVITQFDINDKWVIGILLAVNKEQTEKYFNFLRELKVSYDSTLSG